jgi:flagellar secretion chaperone FliS
MTSIQTYQADAITTASPSQLVLMMYDGVLRAIDLTMSADEVGDDVTVEREIDRAVRILAELRGVLDHERGGEIATNLSSLYTFCIDVIADAVAEGDAAPLASVSQIIGTLRETWADAVC